MPEWLTIVFGLVGGLAMFLFGMNAMSEALQKAAGEKMKKILSFLTKNPVMGAVAGALVTAVLQSSSATTVMVIGFVSAGLMGLPQAISVIFGANIGTTMTAQLIAFKISDYIYPIIFIGFLMNFVAKKEKVKDIGMVIFSFGLLFEGIEVMSTVMKPLASSPIFTDLMSQVKNIPVLGILLGMCMTLVVQSSSATIAVLQSFASQAGSDGVTSVIGLTGAIPILLGDNIGTTITALLASIGQSKNAQRTAIAHSTFNISGSIFFAFLIHPFAAFVQWISPKGPEIQVISRQIANAHTCFNITMTLIWLPLIPIMVKWVNFVIRGKDPSERGLGRPRFLDEKIIGQPVPALYLVSEEIRSSTGKVAAILRNLQASIQSVLPIPAGAAGSGSTVTGKQDMNVSGHSMSAPDYGFSDSEKSKTAQETKKKKKSKKAETVIRVSDDGLTFTEQLEDAKSIQRQIVSYISEMFSVGTLDQVQVEEAAGLLSIANSMDRILDRCDEVYKETQTLKYDQKGFSAGAVSELNKCLQAVQNLFTDATSMLDQEKGSRSKKITKEKNRLRKSLKTFNKNHLVRVRNGECDQRMTQVYTDILYNIDRMGDNSVAIAEEALDHVYYMLPEQDANPGAGSVNLLIDEDPEAEAGPDGYREEDA